MGLQQKGQRGAWTKLRLLSHDGCGVHPSRTSRSNESNQKSDNTQTSSQPPRTSMIHRQSRFPLLASHEVKAFRVTVARIPVRGKAVAQNSRPRAKDREQPKTKKRNVPRARERENGTTTTVQANKHRKGACQDIIHCRQAKSSSAKSLHIPDGSLRRTSCACILRAKHV